MSKITIAFGGLLMILGFAGFVMTGSQHPTALIPAIAGALLELFGVLAMNPKFRMHAMHGAVLIGLLGFLGTIGGLVSFIKWKMGGADPAQPAAVISKSIMCGLCLLFTVLCVRSFIAARRARKQAPGFPIEPTSSPRP